MKLNVDHGAFELPEATVGPGSFGWPGGTMPLPFEHFFLADFSRGLDGAIVMRMYRRLKPWIGKKGAKKYRRAIRNVLLNCEQSRVERERDFGHGIVGVLYARGESNYGSKGRYLGLSYTALIRVLDGMEQLGYLGQKKERKNSRQFLSSFWPTDLLERELRKERFGLHERTYDEEVLFQRDGDKRSVRFDDTKKTKSMRRGICALNAMNAHHQVDVTIPLEYLVLTKDTDGSLKARALEIKRERDTKDTASFIQPTVINTGDTDSLQISPTPALGDQYSGNFGRYSERNASIIQTVIPHYNMTERMLIFDVTPLTKSRRIFCRESWECGGRFYAPIQNLPKALRPFLRLDGEPIVDCDYNALHIRLLYGRLGQAPAGDPYEIELPEWSDKESLRTTTKLALLILLNARSRRAAISAIGARLFKEGLALPRGIHLGDLIAAIEKKHSALRQWFFSDEGVHLQYEDSRIAERVLEAMVDTDRPVIGLHDGFLCRESDMAFLQRVMDEAFRAETGMSATIKTTPYRAPSRAAVSTQPAQNHSMKEDSMPPQVDRITGVPRYTTFFSTSHSEQIIAEHSSAMLTLLRPEVGEGLVIGTPEDVPAPSASWHSDWDAVLNSYWGHRQPRGPDMTASPFSADHDGPDSSFTPS